MTQHAKRQKIALPHPACAPLPSVPRDTCQRHGNTKTVDSSAPASRNPINKNVVHPPEVDSTQFITTTTLTALTWNVHGLTRVATEMDAMIKEHNPDIMFMTETKLTERLHGKAYVKECAPGYNMRYSSIPHPDAGEYRTRSDATVSDRAGSAGVIVALADRHAHSDPITTIPTSKDTRGHLQFHRRCTFSCTTCRWVLC
jgi:hypothetical protein